MTDNEMSIIEVLFDHCFDSSHLSSSEIDAAYKVVCEQLADDEIALIDALCLECQKLAFTYGVKVGFQINRELE